MASYNIRDLAADAVLQVVDQGKSLNAIIPRIAAPCSNEDKSQLQSLCFGVCRHFFSVNALSKMLLDKPLPDDARKIQALIWVGLYQLAYSHMPPHAAIHQTVAAADTSELSKYKGVLNAVLRRFQREQDEWLEQLTNSDVTRLEHPKWLLKLLKKDWPDHWQEIAANANIQAPMCLRVNTHKQNTSEYLLSLKDNNISTKEGKLALTSVYLEKPCAVDELPEFEHGACSVQDEAAQLAGQILAPQAGETWLDACCAPGGKTGHLLEAGKGQINLTALDSDAKRLTRVEENLTRLGYSANVLQGLAQAPETWWDGKQFDGILLDVPCSATGVIRRHPDIKLLRTREDIDNLAQLQQTILQTAWKLLKPGGRLLYATCSVLKAENANNIEGFLKAYPDAQLQPLQFSSGTDTGFGWQFYPQPLANDGFFYALLHKQ